VLTISDNKIATAAAAELRASVLVLHGILQNFAEITGHAIL